MPKVDLIDSIAFTLRRAPIRPTAKSNNPPIMCPSINGIHIEFIGAPVAVCIPASISETEIATPNHMIVFVKRPVRFSMYCPQKQRLTIIYLVNLFKKKKYY